MVRARNFYYYYICCKAIYHLSISHLDSICKLIVVDYTFYEAFTSSFWWSTNRTSTWCRTEDRSRGTRWRENQGYSSSWRAFEKTSWSWSMKIGNFHAMEVRHIPSTYERLACKSTHWYQLDNSSQLSSDLNAQCICHVNFTIHENGPKSSTV